ncbi:MAG: hypothetical protein CMM52_09420 [Rhodospirillaceae bacterium]|nr:hypothetical protein [Rhodospirillaceae bacterium]
MFGFHADRLGMPIIFCHILTVIIAGPPVLAQNCARPRFITALASDCKQLETERAPQYPPFSDKDFSD